MFLASIFLKPIVGGGLLRALLEILSLAGYAFLPLLPTLLIAGLSAIATSPKGIFRLASFISRGRPEIGDLVRADLWTNRRQISRLSLLVSLCVGFGVFFTTYQSATTAFESNLLEVQLPSEIWVLIEETDLADNVTKIVAHTPGVKATSLIPVVDATAPGGTVRVVGVNTTSFLASIRSSGPAAKLAGSLVSMLQANPRGIVASRLAAQTLGWRVGDQSKLLLPCLPQAEPAQTRKLELSLPVVGILDDVPGTREGELARRKYGQPVLAMSSSELPREVLVSRYILLAATAPGAAEEVASQIRERLGLASWTQYLAGQVKLFVYEEELEKRLAAPERSAFSKYMRLESFMVLIVATIGVILALLIIIDQKSLEISIGILRGMSLSHLTTWLGSESVAAGLIGTAAGFTGGFLSGWGYASMMNIISNEMLHVPVVLSWSTVAICMAGLGSLGLATLLVPLYTRRLRVGEILRTAIVRQ